MLGSVPMWVEGINLVLTSSSNFFLSLFEEKINRETRTAHERCFFLMIISRLRRWDFDLITISILFIKASQDVELGNKQWKNSVMFNSSPPARDEALAVMKTSEDSETEQSLAVVLWWIMLALSLSSAAHKNYQFNNRKIRPEAISLVLPASSCVCLVITYIWRTKNSFLKKGNGQFRQSESATVLFTARSTKPKITPNRYLEVTSELKTGNYWLRLCCSERVRANGSYELPVWFRCLMMISCVFGKLMSRFASAFITLYGFSLRSGALNRGSVNANIRA